MLDTDQTKSAVPELKRLIAEHPKFALPVGVSISLIGLATIIRTLIDGFTWAYTQAGYMGVLWAMGGSIVVLAIAITIIDRALMPRPEIQDFPTPYLSKSPTIKWSYKEPKDKKVTYQIVVKEHNTGKVARIGGPQYMYHAEIRGLYGELTITVNAMVNGNKIRSSRDFRTEIYKDSVHRIEQTRKMRVAVHADPGEEIFCFYRDDKWQGFDIDFIELIAKELQSDLNLKYPIEVEYLFYKWPEVISAPNDYKVDFAIASISILAQRARDHNIMFSRPYAESKIGIVAYKSGFVDGKSPVRLDSLIGKTIAFHKATTAAIFVEKMKQDARYKNVTFKLADNNDELRELLKNGSVDGVINDYQRAFALLDQGMFVQHLLHDIEIEPDKYGITFAKISTELRESVDRIIERKQDKLRKMLDERISNQYKKFL